MYLFIKKKKEDENNTDMEKGQHYISYVHPSRVPL